LTWRANRAAIGKRKATPKIAKLDQLMEDAGELGQALALEFHIFEIHC
jgi:hypothetical protein